ncbi:conserved hypothetical protein [Alkaliphilus metalliredigens QYMF]|uniref:DUF3870 domain-containing protein n=1 Tax=Alkaliphilus metalliredigens (strain QYMF) TaxID=293826 RepID=A6TKI3_ALKMQ|nr:DUF3870 domain-containing protein [Alkaliphilus metalliredigens]ABR46701.1 conserved hypothetical protein [Alkaliphilus metalliredigens QYMF]
MYDKDTVYIVGHGRTSSDNAITHHYKIFFISFVVKIETTEIIDLECSATVDITKKFVHSLFIGKKLGEFDEEIEEEIKRRYFGSSQRAIIVAYKDGVKKFNECKQRYYDQ